MMKECDPREQQQRQDILERLYIEDGRHDRSHPRHAIYTGLVVERATREPANG